MRKLLNAIGLLFAFICILFALFHASGKAVIIRVDDGGDEKKMLNIVSTPTPTPTPSQTPTPTPTPSPSPTPTPTPTEKPISEEVATLLERNEEVAQEMRNRNNMAGRLIIDDAGIDVALFTDDGGVNEEEVRQAITDAYDSASLFSDGIANFVADHNNQDFSTLDYVQVGSVAYILRGHSIVTMECTLKINGHNYGHGILDENDESVSYMADYFCYTCQDNWTNIRIVGFEITNIDYIN